MSSAPSEVTLLLQRWTAGDVHARDQLIPLVYDRLRQLAHWRLRSAPGEHSLNTTGLVHEAYIRLVDAPRVELPDRQRSAGEARLRWSWRRCFGSQMRISTASRSCMTRSCDSKP